MFKNTGRCFVFQITLFSKAARASVRERSTSEAIVFREISLDAIKSHLKSLQIELKNPH